MDDIVLNASLTNFAAFMGRKGHPKFKSLVEQVLARDQFTCHYCGFEARAHQEVINLDQHYQNNKLDNLVTACCFCAQCFFLEAVGEAYGGGTLIYLPEISQIEINALCHVLFFAMASESDYKDSAQEIYQTLRSRSSLVEEKWGEGLSEPKVLGQLFIDYQATHNEAPRALLKDLRLLPARGRFKKQIDDWAKLAEEDKSIGLSSPNQ
jgi:intracellular multiplication protein IcmJ